MSSRTSDRRVATPSLSSLAKTQSVRSHRTQNTPSTVRTVITAPPWARDEPPSPTEQVPLSSTNSIHPKPSQSGLSSHEDSSATVSNQHSDQPYGQKGDPPWWMFTRKGRQEGPPQRTPSAKHAWPMLGSRSGGSGEKHEYERPMNERAKSTWLSSSQRVRHGPEPAEGDPDPPFGDKDRHRGWGLHIPIPTPAPFTLSHNRTPGWDTPWSSRAAQQFNEIDDQGGNFGVHENLPGPSDDLGDGPAGRKRSKWYHRRKRIRAFIFYNNYVPLLFRVINITFTAAALAVAIDIRKIERRYNVMGAVGSSPIIVIIFAPLTLVHVMIAIYLEYLGRPLGLWRTSTKLVYTLSETLFICAWSAALSLCFDNFFTSVIGCVSPSAISWYNEIPRLIPDIPNIGRGGGQPGDSICDRQLTLICLVFIGLIMYCTNLFISLFRIFEKVKYHTTALPR
ncbi:hypothetical protein DFH11DRAFT_1559919 [Phellopilus nigrolimitatus]|nr:hypothetical protein DFH11DRAFT_1559919 [Phellopilus nigrolimitatus]